MLLIQKGEQENDILHYVENIDESIINQEVSLKIDWDRGIS